MAENLKKERISEVKTENLSFFSWDLGEEITIKQYLKRLLKTLWEEGEQFNGKRPFGNSGWKWDLYIPLIKNGVLEGEIDKEGFIEAVDEQKGEKIISEIINNL
jgi:hypothetical protein